MFGLGIKNWLIDQLDAFYSKLCRKHLPPYSLRAYVGLIKDFETVPHEFIVYFKLLCGLKMNHTVLDIGCGPGRFAGQLIGQTSISHSSTKTSGSNL